MKSVGFRVTEADGPQPLVAAGMQEARRGLRRAELLPTGHQEVLRAVPSSRSPSDFNRL